MMDKLNNLLVEAVDVGITIGVLLFFVVVGLILLYGLSKLYDTLPMVDRLAEKEKEARKNFAEAVSYFAVTSVVLEDEDEVNSKDR